ncbi:P-type DNA transfer ATPase VirB11 [Parasulfitobacter algicola]|uniref:Type IV secretion system protein n=1 Tax=Parasulfitobacter algicola TaxID=2614809 RepID=A0ABX2IXB8_9RHOB|nr:P-type DNA transfer ATPase VirB11 [Sulfitobacter algicola]NSX56801.1 P-type DNA transfer ATPase VirB11 [Sulfitobacter algicola]
MNYQPSKQTKAPAGLSSFLAPFSDFLQRDDVTEICLNKPHGFFVETYEGWTHHASETLNMSFLHGLATAVGSFTKQEISTTNPILSGTLPDGERIQIVTPPAVPAGTISITIRRPSNRTWSLQELSDMGLFENVSTDTTQMSTEDNELIELHTAKNWVGFLTKAVQAKKNILVSGATGTGKTTFSKALIPLIPAHERLITIEDTVELEIPQENNVRLIYSKGAQGASNVSARELLESSLRMRPDRIFLQELRDATAFYYLRNVNTGHSGSITTIHADSAMLAFVQLALLVKESEAGRDLSRSEIQEMLIQMVDIVIQIKRVGKERRITEIYFDPARKHANEVAS